MTTSSLVLMAAGLGSRFGGVKQLARIGVNGESILDFTIQDALSEGISHVIVIVRSDIADDMRLHLETIHGDKLNVDVVLQDLSGPPREKPWGTAHAVVSAADCISKPFILANADDYYGKTSISLAANQLALTNEAKGGLVSFELANTLSESGSVTRGICSVEDSQLQHIEETEGLSFSEENDKILDKDGNTFDARTPVSMNLWCFDSSMIDLLKLQWEKFLESNSQSSTAECLLPSCVAQIMESDDYKVEVVASSSTWTGITNPEDLAKVRRNIIELRGK